MKCKTFLLVSMFLLLGFSFKTFSQSFEITEIDIGGEPNYLPTGEPQWSPDGTKLAFVSKEWLCVVDIEKKEEIKKIAKIGREGFAWSDSNTFAICEYERDTSGIVMRHKTLNIHGEEKLLRKEISTNELSPNISGLTELPDGTLGYYEKPFDPSSGKKVFHIIKHGKLKPEDALNQMIATTTEGWVGWGAILLEGVDGTVKKRVTKGNATYSFPKLSPDGTKILAVNHRSDAVIFDLDGNELARVGAGVYEGWTPDKEVGSNYAWSPDGKQIAYDLIVESEFDIEASDIYVINTDGTGRTQLTNTTDVIEMYPSWSPDGTKIACYSDNSGKLFVIKLK